LLEEFAGNTNSNKTETDMLAQKKYFDESVKVFNVE